MRYHGNSDYDHQSQAKIGVLLTNLGTPAAPTKKALRRYLKQFLSDPRVVEIPKLVWWLILNGIILNTRPKASAALYQSVWTDMGSPLMFHTKLQTQEVSRQLSQKLYGTEKAAETPLIIDYAMRYGDPSIDEKINSMLSDGVEKIFVLPLYPQYSGSTTGSTFDAIGQIFQKTRRLPELRFLNQYHDHEAYISACAQSINEHWEKSGKSELLLLSYHGVPKSYLDKGDPYHCQCHKTTRLIAEALDLSPKSYMTTFQSRFGKAEWLQPYTDKTLMALPDKGTTSVDIFCPGFSADCLETLEEIAVENKHYFLDAGGKSYNYIPALNASDSHVNALCKIIETNIADWCESEGSISGTQRSNANTNYRSVKENYGKTLY